MEALFLDSEFFENRVLRAAKEGRLEKWCPRASLEEEVLFPVANEIAEHGRNRRMQVHLTESILRLRSLDSTFPYGLCNRDCDPVEVLHFETEQFACSKAAGCEQNVYDAFLLFGLGDNFGNLFPGEDREVPVPDVLIDRLKKHPHRAGRFVFPSPRGNRELHMLDKCKAIAKRAKLKTERFDLKTFRSTYATRMLRSGFDPRTVQHWMGHKSLETTMRYLAPAKDVHDRLNKVEIAGLLGVVSGKKGISDGTDHT